MSTTHVADKKTLLAQLEAKERADAREHLIPFCQYVNPRYVADDIHYLIAEHLEAVYRREIDRLMIFCPPQVGKSTLVSVNLPAWWLGNSPDTPLMLLSYADELAMLHSRAARNTLDSTEYQQLFPGIRTRKDSHAANRWHVMSRGGGMRAAGIGSGITGHPASLGIIDDPIKGTQWAHSEAQLKTIWEFYNNDFLQRLAEDAPIILTMTRWAEHDLAGMILNSKEASRWTVLRIPALSETQKERDANNKKLGLPEGLPDPLEREPGISCVPSRYSTEYYTDLQGSGLEWRWSAIYQGVPYPLEGKEIKRSWFKIIPRLPDHIINKIRYWDLAGTEGAGARTAGLLMVKDKENNVYIVDVTAGQWGIAERNKIIDQVASEDAVRFAIADPEHPDLPLSSRRGYNSVQTYIEQEPGSGGKEAMQLRIQAMAGYAVYADPVSRQGSKDARMVPFISYAKVPSNMIYLIEGEWNEAYLAELAAYPEGSKRDMCDATSGAFNKLQFGGFGLGIASAS